MTNIASEVGAENSPKRYGRRSDLVGDNYVSETQSINTLNEDTLRILSCLCHLSHQMSPPLEGSSRSKSVEEKYTEETN